MLRCPRFVRLVCAALVPVLILAAAPPCPDADPAAIQLLFDVADLVTPPGAGPLTVRVTPKGAASMPETNQAGTRLVERVMMAVAPFTWAGRGGAGTITYRADDRTLLVEQSPAAQRQVRDFLRTVRRHQDAAVVLETFAVSVTQETAERVRLVFDPTEGGVIDEDQFIRVKKLIGAAAQSSVLSAPTMSCWTNQSIDVHLDQEGIAAEFGMAPTISVDRRAVRPNLRLRDDRIGGTPFEGLIPQGSTLVLPGRAVTSNRNIPANRPEGRTLLDGPWQERADRVFVFLTPRVLPRTEAERAKTATTRDRVFDELDEIGSASPARRESAYQRLWKIGPQALGLASSMARFDRERRWEITSRFCREMQEKYGVAPVQGDGIKVEPVVEQVWNAPPPGGKTPVRLALKVTNVGKQPISFDRLGTITPFITTSEGAWNALQGTSRDHFIIPAERFKPLEPGQGFTDEAGSVELHTADDGKSFRVSIYDTTGAWGGIRGLQRGRNYVSFEVRCFPSFERSGWSVVKKDPHPIWFGEVYSALICIEIR